MYNEEFKNEKNIRDVYKLYSVCNVRLVTHSVHEMWSPKIDKNLI